MLFSEAEKAILISFRDAIEADALDDVCRILEHNPEVLTINTPLGPWLLMAVRDCGADVVNALLQHDLDPNIQHQESRGNALHAAAAVGKLDNVKLLHKAGAILDTTETSANPLFAAVHGRNVEVAQYLLDAGIDSTIKYETRRTLKISALDFAWEMGARDIARAIALHQTGGDEAAAQVLLDEAHRIALENTEEPVAE